MASTYSTNLALELIANGDQTGSWGTTTNTNLGTLIEQAVSGYVTQTITDGADTTITIPNGATGVARNMTIEMTGTLTAARNLIVPANKKLYFIYNNTTGGYAVTVKVSGQTGVSVPNGKKVILVSNGTDIVSAENYIASLSLGSALTVANGGTGATTFTSGAILKGAGTGAITTATAGTDYVAPGGALGTPSSGTLTNATGLPLSTGVTGTLPVANGGTGATSLTANNVLLGNGTSALQVVAPGSNGNVLTSNGTTWTSAAAATGITTTTGSAPYYGARAWVNFYGVGTGSINASVNVSSITYNGTGDYTVNFSTAMADANYSVVANGKFTSNAGASTVFGVSIANYSGNPASGSVRLVSGLANNSTQYDFEVVCVAIFR
jgi:hypothetical protein